ncbi:MAG: hypothetical protein A2086_15450 [Spirochaetes bacterium GWD1_27_9]|nr:MAG: hypothetical protein A2Z98_17920 [Spirochaetes bacterium GWB1_27_13]OHD27582.1 MAG: hypothetical protein A2Y34_01885 [Spirochaetes bacterium GWC1_27_15]OHD42778.1 MAG: hypothetical protein A2086_15450 [Spirochaetes bacterium GWD1_27_9]
MEIYLSTEYLDIYVDRELSFLYQQWKKSVSTEQFRKGFTKMLEIIRKNNLVSVIAEPEKLGAISNENQKWLDEIWLKQVFDVDIKDLLVIYPKCVLSRLSTKIWVNNTFKLGINIAYVEDIKKSIEFIKKQKIG